MKKGRIIILCGLVVIGFFQTLAAKNKKLAQTGFQFLSVNSDGRSAALSGAVTTSEMGSASLFFNPAGMANMVGTVDLTASYNSFIADIRHQTFSAAFSPFRGEYGVFGLTLQTVDYGEIQGTRVAKTDKGFEDTELFSPTALAVGVGYARRLTDRFSVGGQVKVTHQDLFESRIVTRVLNDTTFDTKIVKNTLSPLAFDFGTLFKTGFKSLCFGMSVRNFSEEVKFSEEGFQLPLIFQMGISMDLFDLWKPSGVEHSLVLSIDATHDRSYPEQLLVGLDYRLMKILSLRGGYVSTHDASHFSFGFGISYLGLTLDYAYTPFGIFDKVQRMTARFTL